ncbi:hypothetical protein GCM10023191_102150 [Actinoallomurus oryzae]|uniref:Uncharacterized protein n=1 Tax=Actinoallomurus oryzae TaxID=502180 RepID=A0ABP8R9J2_9ACTN
MVGAVAALQQPGLFEGVLGVEVAATEVCVVGPVAEGECGGQDGGFVAGEFFVE